MPRGGRLTEADGEPAAAPPAGRRRLDLADVSGQHEARAALLLAAAGGHHMLLNGPPGSGKTMLAERLVTILPLLTREQALESLAVRSVVGAMPTGIDLVPPFVAPHHSASVAALVGGGSGAVLPGAVSQAHHGVLFLDEAAEFGGAVLQALRQPLESGRIVVSRAREQVTYPARVQLIAAMNPCRCGHLADASLACARAPRCAADYQSRISGPLIDRIDLFVDIQAVKASDVRQQSIWDSQKLMRLPKPESSADVRRRVIAAQAVRDSRRLKERSEATNTDTLAGIEAMCDLSALEVLDSAISALGLGVRDRARVLRVSRTIADLAASEKVCRDHILEAAAYRRLTSHQWIGPSGSHIGPAPA